MSGLSDFLSHLDRLQQDQERRSEETITLRSSLCHSNEALAAQSEELLRMQRSHAEVSAHQRALCSDIAAADIALYDATRDVESYVAALSSLQHALTLYKGPLLGAYQERRAAVLRSRREACHSIQRLTEGTQAYRDHISKQQSALRDLEKVKDAYVALRDETESIREAVQQGMAHGITAHRVMTTVMPWDPPEAVRLVERIIQAEANGNK